MVRILVAESDPAEALAVAVLFRRQGFEVAEAADGRAAIAAAAAADLVVLGLDLPDLDGLEVCRRIRAGGAVPIIATTARDTEVDLIAGLRAGLDAYLVRPYGPCELVARAEAILRRTGARGGCGGIVCGPLSVDPRTREVYLHGRLVRLTRKEFDLLRLLAAEPGRVFGRREIMSVVWQDEWARTSRTIDTHVSSLRAKLGDPSAIRTVRGIGFRIGYTSGDVAGPRPSAVLDVVLT